MGKSQTEPIFPQGGGRRLGPAPALLLGWLIPGAGFIAHGRLGRGATLFVALHLTFALGLLLHGGVVWPVWSLSDPAFNIVNNLTFIVQMGGGLGALASLAVNLTGSHGPLAFLAADPMHPLFDLSSVYLLVVGAMNYFVVCNMYDRFFAGKRAAGGVASTKEEPRV
ncbi:MAG: hypothetical protein NTW86_10580 [Candidatus Sumerlaeota bacterium]|nr:hypothetical protein [Candidatus Sumerlaeota bacterium]